MTNQTSSPQTPPKKDRTCLKVFVFACCVLAVLATGAVYVVKQAIRATLKITESSMTRQVAVALLAYEQNYHSFPPPYTVDANGKKLHSWRTLILPYIDERPLYEAIDLSKPWDAPENARPRSISVGMFCNVLADIDPGETVYRVISHPGGVFADPTHPTKLSDIQDPANTILVVQSGSDQAIHWMQPDDYSLADFLAITNANSVYAKGGTYITTCNGSVREIHVQDLGPQQIEDMIIIKKDSSTAQP